MAWAAQQHRVHRGQQRRALAPGGHVGTSEVRHNVDAAAFGDGGRIAQLQREGVLACRAMAHGLAVRADGVHGCGRRTAFPEQCERSLGKAMAQCDVQPPEGVQVDGSLALRHGQDLFAQRRRPRVRTRGKQAGAFLFERHQRGVDAVGAGAGDQAEVQRRGLTHAGGGLSYWCLVCCCGPA